MACGLAGGRNAHLCPLKRVGTCAHTKPFLNFIPLFRHRVAETGQGILTNMFEHVVRVYEEACPVEQRREPRRGGGLGSRFLWLLSFGETKESNLLSGNPRRFWFYKNIHELTASREEC